MTQHPQHPQQDQPPLSGILVIDKPYAMTSMTVCSSVRARLRRGGAPKRVKVGHGGTLDPLATGVLVVLVGKATPLCNAIMEGQKEYLAGIDLSATSPTDDLESEPVPVPGAAPPNTDTINEVCARFIGTIQQRPPAHSAVKIGGERSYARARRGETIEPEPRPVRIDAIDIVSLDWPVLTLRVVSGKGVYIRSLARDVGRELTGGGVLVSLRRTRVGAFDESMAVGLDDLPRVMTSDDLLPVPAHLARPRPADDR